MKDAADRGRSRFTSLHSFQAQLLRAVGQAVVATDLQGRVTYWNPAAEALYGWSAAEALGRPVAELMLAPAGVEKAREIVDVVLSGRTWSGELPARRKDGSTFPARVHDAPIRDETGRVIGIVGVSFDLTPGQASERALRESHERFELASRATSDVIWEWDVRTGRVQRNLNYALLLGHPQDHAQRLESWYDHVHPEDVERVKASVERALRSDAASWSDEYRYRRADGTYAHVLDRAYIVRDAEGQVERVIGAMIDLSPQVKAQQELLAAHESLAHAEKLSALGMLVSGVAHEVKTPLAYIATNLHLLKTRLEIAAAEGATAADAMARVEQHLLDALQGVDRINQLVLELRRFQKVPLRSRGERSLDVPVAAAAELFRATSKGRAKLRLDLAPTRPARMDEAQVQQIVLNLMENAADANPGGTIHVWTRDRHGRAELAVRDEGPGIPDEVRAHIFDAFVTTKAEGTGLGLAIVQRIARDHGARLEVESAPGAGTTMRVTFPVSNGDGDGGAPDA